MAKRLQIKRLQQRLDETGSSQASLAKDLGVSREAVSKWFKGESFPATAKLLQLAKRLQLTASELLARESTIRPIVAFRKKASAKTTQEHLQRAEDMGMLLRPLVSYLPFDTFVGPATLKNPSADYDYLQSLATKVRQGLGLSDNDPVEFHHLVKCFADTQSVLIPVLWGKVGQHENALHIFLPDSTTTWIFLNLDVEVHDFKFWMAHEYGHVMTPELRGEEAEDFADAFAGALLMPRAAAEIAYVTVFAEKGDGARINAIKSIAEQFLISPYGVYVQINAYAASRGKPLIQLIPAIHGASRNLSKDYYTVSGALFGADVVDAKELISYAEHSLGSPFFSALSSYLKDSGKGPGFIQSVLHLPALDARELHAALG